MKEDDKKAEDDTKQQDEAKTDDKKETDPKIDEEKRKRIESVLKRLEKFNTTVEQADQNVIDNANQRKEERKKLFNEIETMEKELEPFREKDEQILNQKVKEEVESALLVIMDKKYKAELEIIELKKLLKDRNNKVFELEQENKRLVMRNSELEDIIKGVPPRAHQSQNEAMTAALQSQDGGFDRAQDELVYDQPPSQDDEDDFWQEGKAAKAGYGGNDNDLWITGNNNNLPATNLNAYNASTNRRGKAQPPGFNKSIPKRAQGYDPNDDMAFYGVGVTGARKV